MKHLFTCLLSLLLVGTARAQSPTPPLQAGDIALLGFDATDPDDFAFTPLVDLAPGTQLKFTDNGWLPTGGFRLTEGICIYTAPAAGVARGTVVSFRADSAAFTHPGRFLLATDGD
ncbi:hypothetical protein QMK33_10880 [Hymenobacter sp. H14-R3]|uniref:hypothetical protein n=1 Tax=Hymenobacter sp. H14-R3 TaxID=3046308 RepID=UPI0024BB9B19|nr:hypothetical protein [Hymenobacter sp. H14-R3]MDJ0365657.1 hypothetical protein [Hymenobacter sp. H14-R3]